MNAQTSPRYYLALPLPTSIKSCPILEALFEIRFTANVPNEAVFGVLYPDLSADFPKSDSLPVVQLPPQIREVNPQLRFQPTHRLTAERYVVAIGPKVFSLSTMDPYPGWADFRRKLIPTIEVLLRKSVIKTANRFGLRYINMFDGDVTKRLTLEIKLQNQPIDGKKTFLRTVMEKDNSKVTLQVGKDQTIKRRSEFTKTGTLIDIDVSRDASGIPTLHDLETVIDEAHLTAKTLFFDLLKPDFLKELQPVY